MGCYAFKCQMDRQLENPKADGFMMEDRIGDGMGGPMEDRKNVRLVM